MNDPTTRELMQKIAMLEAGFEALQLKLDKEIRHNGNMDRLNTELRKLIEADVIGAFERIKNIELKIFPNLANDILHMNKIVGEGQDSAWNPLDHREP